MQFSGKINLSAPHSGAEPQASFLEAESATADADIVHPRGKSAGYCTPITKERLHHAYLIEAKIAEGMDALRQLMDEFGIATTGNPDFHELQFDALSIDNARDLREAQSFYGAEGAKKIFLVAFNTIGHEAQNALLKTLEDPTAGTHFFFVTETREHLLPTFLSRVQVITREPLATSHQPLEGAGEEFLRATIAERMKMIEPMTKAKAEDKPKAKEDARRFLESLERALYEKSFQGDSLALPARPKSDAGGKGVSLETHANDTSVPPRFDESQGSTLNPDSQGRTFADPGASADITSALKNIIIAKRHLSSRSPSVKLLLEHLALTVPRVSK
ncbi:MAG: hypothetical protein Q7S52_02875 [bacterium]|nr:hypothetical protein [bacterium]